MSEKLPLYQKKLDLSSIQPPKTKYGGAAHGLEHLARHLGVNIKIADIFFFTILFKICQEYYGAGIDLQSEEILVFIIK